MSTYVVLARKWRPAQFTDIVGQGHVVRTLANAIQHKRLHHAFLFTGSRGIGKTSIARIFSKVIRCENTKEENGWLKSCDACSSCKEIAGGNSVDVIEIDGASNNGVDAVREIRENTRYLPASGSRKIYIIDEVHMLTTAAFNALLKTLEEPPPHVIFVFATTEPHKIPATILSRVQRFDFKRVTSFESQKRLQEITTAEGVQIEPAALALIARAAEGSMRDALSILDQVISFCGNTITAKSVRECVGLTETQTLLGILKGIYERKPLDSLALIDQVFQQGHDLRVLTRSLIETLHASILAKVGAPPSAVVEFSEEERQELAAVSKLRPLEEIELIFQVFHHGIDWIARSPQPKIVLDVLVVKCATAEMLVPVGSVPGVGPTSSAVTDSRPAVPMYVPSPPTAVITSPASETTPAPPSAASAEKSWAGFIELVRKSRPLLASILEHGSCAALPTAERKAVKITFAAADSYYKEQLQSRVYAEQLTLLAREYFVLALNVQVEHGEGPQAETLAERKEKDLHAREEAAKSAVHNHPIIKEAKALFGAELGAIVLTDPDGQDGPREGSHSGKN
ncbi:DNA polymerase III subunit gamma/tau [Bdellovibrionota bacterium FG-2]